MIRIEIWLDGGGCYGFGNIRRSTELARALTKRGHRVRCVPLSQRAADLCPLPHGIRNGAEIVVLDVPYAGDIFVEQAHASGASVLALDYEGEVPPELVISLQSYRSVPSTSRVFCGVDYAIIREDVRRLAVLHERTGEILVIVGGGDQDRLSERIAEQLLGLPLCVVQGPNGPDLNLRRGRVRVVVNPTNLPELMASCAWSVTTGGTTMLEMLCLGKATYVVPRTDAEWVFADHFHSKGALLGIGLKSLGKPDIVSLRRCESLGPRLVDGRGCERIALALETLL